MGMIILGLRNLLRNKLRHGLAVVAISVPVILLLVMQATGDAVAGQTDALRRDVDTLLQLRASGSLGHVNMKGSDHLLPTAVLEQIKGIEHVVKVEPYLLAMQPTEGPNFAMHVGVNPGDALRLESHGEAGNPRIIAGRGLRPEDQGRNVGLIGQGYAELAGITAADLGRTTLAVDPRRSNPAIYALDQAPREVTIVGIYASGYVFGDLQLFLPSETFRNIYGVDEQLSWLFVRVDTVDHLAAVERRIRQVVGDTADVIAQTNAAAFEATTTRTITRLADGGGLLALTLMVIVVFFLMLIQVRERAREIGTMKAIGAHNGGVAAQFLTEAAALTALGGLLGATAFWLLGGVITGGFVEVVMGPFLPAQYETLFDSLSIDAGGSPAGVGLALLASVVAASVGGAYGVWQITRLSPLEATRHE